MLRFIFLKILFMSIGMTVSGMAVLCSTKIFSGVFTKRQCYYLWLIPVILAIVPVMVKPGSEQVNTVYENTAYVTEAMPLQEKQADENDTPVTSPVQNTAPGQKAAEIKTTDNTYTQKSAALPSISYAEILSLVYFLGITFLTLRYVYISVKFRKKFFKTAEPCWLEILDKCKNQTALKSRVDVYSVNCACSPFVYGIIHPKLIISNGNITYEALIHELTHIKRRDLLYLLVMNIVKILHFFNPFVYLYSREIKKNMELSCDESASALMEPPERLAYGKCILNYSASPSPSIACLSENGKNIKERLEVIMKPKNYTKTAKMLSILLSLILITCPAVFASAVNTNAPVKSYIINNATEVYSVVYEKGDEWHYSKTSGIDKNRASLVNTEVFKGFSADLSLEFINNLNYVETDEKTNANVHVEMDKFIKSINNGKVWQGLFTVIMDNEVVLSSAKGYLNNVPGEKSSNMARLYIEDGDTSFEIEHINFDAQSDSIINSEYEDEQADMFEADVERYLSGTCFIKYTHDGVTDTKESEDTNLIIRANTAESRLSLGILSISLLNNKYISTIPGEKYTFTDNSASGKFFLNQSGNIIIDELDGTLSGILGSSISFKSADGNISVDMTVSDDEDLKEQFNNPRISSTDVPFLNTCVQTQRRLRLADLPFTLTLNEDKTKVILKIKDGFNPEAWYYSYSSYTNTDKDVYSKYHSKYGERTTELDICEVYGHHNLQFHYYNINPYVYKSSIDIMFKIVNGELLYSSCSEYITENKSYSGEEGLASIKKWLATYPSFDD